MGFCGFSHRFSQVENDADDHICRQCRCCVTPASTHPPFPLPSVVLPHASGHTTNLQVPQPNSTSRSNPSQISKAQVLADLEVMLAQQEHNLQLNPYDSMASQHVKVLQQVHCYLFPSAHSPSTHTFIHPPAPMHTTGMHE